MWDQVDHIKQPDNFALVEAARVIYMAGFFMTVSPETIDLVAKKACEQNKILCMVHPNAFPTESCILLL